jgi:hypothetical protein
MAFYALLDVYVAYRKSCRATDKTIVASQGKYYNDLIKSAAADPRWRWAAIRDVLHRTESHQLRSDAECSRLRHGFALFFSHKIHCIKETINARLGSTLGDPLKLYPHHSVQMLADISAPCNDEIRKLILPMPSKSSPIDRIPTSVIKSCVGFFCSFDLHSAGWRLYSFTSSRFSMEYGQVIVRPLLKKGGMDADVFVNYRAVSNLNTISKTVERVHSARLNGSFQTFTKF